MHESLGKSKLCGLDDELHAPSAHELVDVRAIGEAHHAGERLRVAEEDRVEALAAELDVRPVALVKAAQEGRAAAGSL